MSATRNLNSGEFARNSILDSDWAGNEHLHLYIFFDIVRGSEETEKESAGRIQLNVLVFVDAVDAE